MHLLLVQSSDWGGKCRDLPPAAAAPGEAAQAPPDVRYRRGPRGDHSQPLRRAGTGRRRRSQGMDQCGAGHVPSPVRSADARQCSQPVRPPAGPPGPHLSPSLPVSHRRLGTARHVSEILTNGRAGRPSCRKAIRSIGRGCVSSIFLQYTTHSLLALSLGQENLLRCARVPAIRACGWRESLLWPRFKEGVRAYPLLHLEHAV